jgi:thioredoxin 1
MMKRLNSTDSLDNLLSTHEHSLLFFSALWCGPCQSMTPVIEKVSNAMHKRLNIIKVDVDESKNDAIDYGIRSVPTLLLVKNNEIIAQQVGAMPPVQLMQWLDQYI